MMFRHCCMKRLLAALLAFQAAVFFIVATVIGKDLYSAYFSLSSISDKSANETLALNNSVPFCRSITDDRLTNRTLTNSTGVSYSSGNDHSTNEADTLNTFLVEYEKYCSSHLIPMASNITTGNARSLCLCPCVPDALLGRINTKFETPQFRELELLHTELSLGGSWTPQLCIPRHRVAVIIPFRDRQLHLRTLLTILHPMLQRQMLRYTIFVVEQKEPTVFNKGSLMNAGFIEARSFADFDCFIFHDVDMLPEDDRNFYVCSSQPRHVGSHVDKFNYTLIYSKAFGGVIAIRPSQFKKTNGFSNRFSGWGGEDDDMYNRIKAQKMTVKRFPSAVARYTMIRHSRDVGNPNNPNSVNAFRYNPHRYAADGLNSLRYKLVANESRALYTWLLVALPSHIQPNAAYRRYGRIEQQRVGTGGGWSGSIFPGNFLITKITLEIIIVFICHCENMIHSGLHLALEIRI